MHWDPKRVDLNKLRAVAAPFGGPIALKRHEGKLLAVDQSNFKPTIQIYTSSGQELGVIPWNEGILVKMGWTNQERLVCILEDGIVLQYTVQGELVSRYSLGPEVASEGAFDALIFGSGLAVLTRQFQIFVLQDWDEPRSFKFPDPLLKSPPTAWTAIPPELSPRGQLELLIATASGTVLVVDSVKIEDMLLSNGPFTRLALSPSGKILASYNEKGDLWVTLVDFSQNFCDLEIGKGKPDQMAWCGNDSVCVFWPGLLLVVGPKGETLKYECDEFTHLVQEIDGLRVISQSVCELLQKVPPATEQVFSSGSISPGARLHDANDHFEQHSPAADEVIRSIKDNLSEAVDACLDAASFEFTPGEQRKLLKSASFGKCFLDFYNPDPFTNMCQTLRVLNAVRHYKIGIPLTYKQYLTIGPNVLIDRLINHHHHLLACRISEYLKIKVDRVLIHWACCKVKSSASDQDTARAIVEKLSQVPGIAYAEIASTAYRCRRTQLATSLLENEPRAANTVPLLLSMGQEDAALEKAIQSGDTDLVHLVLLQLQKAHPIAQEFFSIVLSKPVARDLFIAYSKQKDPGLLRELYRLQSRPQDLGLLEVKQAWKVADLDRRIGGLQTALSYFKAGKEAKFCHASTEEQIRLYLTQKELEGKHKTDFVDLSLGDTCYKLMLLGDAERAQSLAGAHKMDDRAYTWIRIKALSKMGDWEELENFAGKKSPVGYEPFA